MSIKIASVLALCSSMAIAAPAIWDGTADVSWYVSSAQAYNLTTAEQLAGLAKLVNQGTSSFEGKNNHIRGRHFPERYCRCRCGNMGECSSYGVDSNWNKF